MLNFSLFVLFVLVVSLVYQFSRFTKSRELTTSSMLSFGEPSIDDSITTKPTRDEAIFEIKKLQISQFKIQQSIAFIILSLSILTTLVIAAIVLFKLTSDLDSFKSAVGVVSGLTLSTTSFRYFRIVSKAYSDKVKELDH